MVVVYADFNGEKVSCVNCRHEKVTAEELCRRETTQSDLDENPTKAMSTVDERTSKPTGRLRYCQLTS